jgi:TPR repeat protein
MRASLVCSSCCRAFALIALVAAASFGQGGAPASIVPEPNPTLINAKKYYTDRQYSQALPLFLEAAHAGNREAASYLGIMYEKGRGVPKDDVQAVSWYRKAAEAGAARGMFNLGVMYADGRGVPKDDAQAVSWYRKAAETGHAGGMTNLGIQS